MTPFEIEDQFGIIRRCGSFPSKPPANCGLKAFASAAQVWTRDECRKAIVAKSWKAQDYYPGEGEDDQKSHGSCNGYALANGAWRAAYAGGNKKLTKRSGSYPYSLMNGGQDNGSNLYDGFKVGQLNGLPSLASCGWDTIYRAETKQFDAEAAQFKVDAPVLIHDFDELATAAAGPYLLIVAVQVGRNFERMNGDIIGYDAGSGNHAVCADDARVNSSGDIEYKILMDWGLQHGVQGCGWVTERHLATTVQNHQFYAIPYGQNGAGVIQ